MICTSRSRCDVIVFAKFFLNILSIMYALIYFKHEREFDIVNINKIKRFQPKDVKDFKKDKVYAVKWGDSTSSSTASSPDELQSNKKNIYEAFILQLSESEAELQRVLQSDKRLRIPNVTISATEPMTETEDDTPSVSHIQKQQKLSLVADEKRQKSEKLGAIKKRMADILSQHKAKPVFEIDAVDIDSSDDDLPTYKPKKRKRETESSRKCDECSRLRLQISKLEEKVAVVTNLNLKLQTSYFQRINEHGAPPKKRTELSKKYNNESGSPPPPSPQPSPPRAATKSSVNPEQVEKLSIPDSELRQLDRKKKPSLFTKNLSVKLFGTVVLRNSSLEGKASNRMKTPGRQALDAEKVEEIKTYVRQCYGEVEVTKVNRYITEKIADLRKLEKQN